MFKTSLKFKRENIVVKKIILDVIEKKKKLTIRAERDLRTVENN